MITSNDVYGQILAKRSSELNQSIEELKKLEAYAVCAKDTLAHMQNFMNSQIAELQRLFSSEKISKQSVEITQEVLVNVMRSLKSIEEESLKNYYVKLGTTEFIKKDMTELVNSRALAQEAAQEAATSIQEHQE